MTKSKGVFTKREKLTLSVGLGLYLLLAAAGTTLAHGFPLMPEGFAQAPQFTVDSPDLQPIAAAVALDAATSVG